MKLEHSQLSKNPDVILNVVVKVVSDNTSLNSDNKSKKYNSTRILFK